MSEELTQEEPLNFEGCDLVVKLHIIPKGLRKQGATRDFNYYKWNSYLSTQLNIQLPKSKIDRGRAAYNALMATPHEVFVLQEIPGYASSNVVNKLDRVCFEIYNYFDYANGKSEDLCVLDEKLVNEMLAEMSMSPYLQSEREKSRVADLFKRGFDKFLTKHMGSKVFALIEKIERQEE